MSSEIRRFRCFLIGSESLLAECAETLLKQGHEILGVITSARKLSAWAHGRNPVSYTHLDVYKRQSLYRSRYPAGGRK